MDPFSGTGTTALAAKRLGRNFIGLELDKEYVQISENKLRREEANSKIGDVWVSFYFNEIINLRNIDWEKLANRYVIPVQIKDIDHTAIVANNGKRNGYSPKKNGVNDLPLFSQELLEHIEIKE